MIRQPLKKSVKYALTVASVLLLIGGYTLMSHLQHKKNPKDTTIPNWGQLKEGVHDCVKTQRNGERWLVVDTKASLSRFALGVGAGVLGALIVGLLMGCFASVEAFIMPPLTLVALIPPTAALAVYFVLVGTGMGMYISMISLGIGATLARSIYLSVKEVPSELLFKAYTLGASRWEIILDTIFQQVLPSFINAVRLHIAPAMIFLIAAEMVVGDAGFGYRIRLQSRLINMNVVYPYLAMLALFGYLMDFLLRKLQDVVSPWYNAGGR